MKNLVQKHSYLDLSYVYGTLSNRGGENPLDYPAMMADPAELVIVAADARTGKARYFMKDELRQDDYTPLMAPAASRSSTSRLSSTAYLIMMAVWRTRCRWTRHWLWAATGWPSS